MYSLMAQRMERLAFLRGVLSKNLEELGGKEVFSCTLIEQKESSYRLSSYRMTEGNISSGLEPELYY